MTKEEFLTAVYSLIEEKEKELRDSKNRETLSAMIADFDERNLAEQASNLIRKQLAKLDSMVKLPIYMAIQSKTDEEVEIYKQEKIGEIEKQITKAEQEKTEKEEELKRLKKEFESLYKDKKPEEGLDFYAAARNKKDREKATETLDKLTEKIEQLKKEIEEIRNKNSQQIKNSILDKIGIHEKERDNLSTIQNESLNIFEQVLSTVEKDEEKTQQTEKLLQELQKLIQYRKNMTVPVEIDFPNLPEEFTKEDFSATDSRTKTKKSAEFNEEDINSWIAKIEKFEAKIERFKKMIMPTEKKEFSQKIVKMNFNSPMSNEELHAEIKYFRQKIDPNNQKELDDIAELVKERQELENKKILFFTTSKTKKEIDKINDRINLYRQNIHDKLVYKLKHELSEESLTWSLYINLQDEESIEKSYKTIDEILEQNLERILKFKEELQKAKEKYNKRQQEIKEEEKAVLSEISKITEIEISPEAVEIHSNDLMDIHRTKANAYQKNVKEQLQDSLAKVNDNWGIEDMLREYENQGKKVNDNKSNYSF